MFMLGIIPGGGISAGIAMPGFMPGKRKPPMSISRG
jgi:hypothetical protein